MKFRLRPILSEIKELYLKPISNKRFEEYISKLQGNSKGDLALPIGGFNPMAKQHIIAKIDELEKIEAEKLMEEVIEGLNSNLEISSQQEILVVLNIADDLKGGWTNYYTTDFDSKFKLNAFVKRNFCVPYFWTSLKTSSPIKSYLSNRTIDVLTKVNKDKSFLRKEIAEIIMKELEK